MALKIVNDELFKFAPSTPIDLFELDTTMLDDNSLPTANKIMYFHNYASEKYLPVYFGGIRYSCVPVKISGNEWKGDGSTLPVPKIQFGNADGMFSYLLRQTDGLIGSKITRKKTFAKFLDGTTWGLPANQNPFGTPFSDGYATNDVFYVNRITKETRDFVELEGATPLELYKTQIPRRRMFFGSCTFEYRNSLGCDYQGVPAADVSNKRFAESEANGGYGFTLTNRGLWSSSATYNKGNYVYVESSILNEDGTAKRRFYYVCLENGVTGSNTRPQSSSKWIADNCSRRLGGCLCRFNKNNLPFGAYPALIRAEFE